MLPRTLGTKYAVIHYPNGVKHKIKYGPVERVSTLTELVAQLRSEFYTVRQVPTSRADTVELRLRERASCLDEGLNLHARRVAARYERASNWVEIYV